MVERNTYGVDLERGATVVTSDGETLGTIGETRPGHFKVETSGGKDYWLGRECVSASSARLIVVGFTAAARDDYRLSDPGAAGVVPGGPRGRAYIPDATPEDANELWDPKYGPEDPAA